MAKPMQMLCVLSQLLRVPMYNCHVVYRKHWLLDVVYNACLLKSPSLLFHKILEGWERGSDMYIPIKTEKSTATYSLHVGHFLFFRRLALLFHICSDLMKL